MEGWPLGHLGGHHDHSYHPVGSYEMKYARQSATIGGAVDVAKSTAEELKDELESWKDNLPENLQDGGKADELQEAIDQLEEAIDKLETGIPEDLSNFTFEYRQRVFSPSERRKLSRAKRMEESTDALCGVPGEVPEEFDGHGERDEMESALGDISEALDYLNSVNFPGMR